MTVSDPRRNGDVRIIFRAEQELRDALGRIASRNDRTLSAEIRRALKKHVTAESRASA